MIAELNIGICSGTVLLARIKDNDLWIEILSQLIHKQIVVDECDFLGAQNRCSVRLEASEYHFDIAIIHNQELWLRLLRLAMGKDDPKVADRFIEEFQCFSAIELHNKFPALSVPQCAARIGHIKRKINHKLIDSKSGSETDAKSI
jgi:hypothetical protein